MNVYNLRDIPSQAKIRKFLKEILFGEHIFCPECRTRKITKVRNRYWCKRCRIYFSLLSHTWLSNSKLTIEQVWVVLWCWTKQIPVKQTQDITTLSEKAVRHHFSLFRKHLPEDTVLLEHIVQLDEAYFGGMLGFALLMGKQKGTRKLAYTILPHNKPTKIDAHDFLREYVKEDIILATDGGIIYKDIAKYFSLTHTVDVHKKFEFTNTSEIEGMFGVLRTFIRRMYHHTTPKHFPEYMCEFYFRFCHPELFISPHEYLKNTLSLATTG